MNRLKEIKELKALAEACAKYGVPIVEPTGGLDPDNVAQVVKVCLDAGVERVIPHIYTSIVDKATGRTVPELARKAYENLKALV